MAGHSHFAGIKHRKEAQDAKRGQLFSKLLNAVTVAAKQDPNPDFNPRLRAAVDKAKENKVPQENIERAIKRAAEAGSTIEELLVEAYGPGGAAILIEAATDSKNRTVAEIKNILKERGGKWAKPSSVGWAFEESREGAVRFKPKFPQTIPEDDRPKLEALIKALESHGDIQKVFTNVSF